MAFASAASVGPLAAGNGLKMANSTTTQAYLESKPVQEAKALLTELCRQFYHLGWVGGTGGSITLKVHDDSIPKPQQIIIMSPSGVQKERMLSEDMYVLSSDGSTVSAPSPKPYPNKPPKCSDCGPLFMKDHQLKVYDIKSQSFVQAYQMRNAGAVIHSHGMESCLVTMMNPTSNEFRITHMEMIKGIQGHGYYDELVVPIIENSAHERDLTDALAAAIEAYPKTTAVLVRNHGIYVWGDSWISAKTQTLLRMIASPTGSGKSYTVDDSFSAEERHTPRLAGVLLIVVSMQAECYHYLFDAAIKLNQMGLDWSTPTHGPIKRIQADFRSGERAVSAKAGTSGLNPGEPKPRCIVLDIEGTTTPISFVTDVLFPYARDNVGRHLSSTYDSPETQDDIKLLRGQVEEDLKAGVVGAVPIPSDDEGKEEVIAALVANVGGHIWRTGFQNNELEGVVFEDRCIVLDIEGTTTPISFVTDVLFPYARDNVGRHLSSTYDSPETQDDIKLLRGQVEEDLKAGVVGAVPIPSDDEGKEEVIAALVANVGGMIKADRKITALKQLQGHIWRTGFQNNELEGVVFEDVPEALERWHSSGIKVYIYSSGSRLAQRLIFGNTKYGDLRKYLCGFFDTAVGNKRETQSYVEIFNSMGVDDPSEILFVTDVYQEATAAKEAGLEVLISVRPGNGPLPENHGFKTVNSFSEI
uniref:Probable bifunctional methylthioribulose-1-phosphate dehydratase/enolase-phosphatase E1 n=1 Tax=Chenopodium quinoa TaxID=63459 RepID=A0A803N242_CHEQI